MPVRRQVGALEPLTGANRDPDSGVGEFSGDRKDHVRGSISMTGCPESLVVVTVS